MCIPFPLVMIPCMGKLLGGKELANLLNRTPFTIFTCQLFFAVSCSYAHNILPSDWFRLAHSPILSCTVFMNQNTDHVTIVTVFMIMNSQFLAMMSALFSLLVMPNYDNNYAHTCEHINRTCAHTHLLYVKLLLGMVFL